MPLPSPRRLRRFILEQATDDGLELLLTGMKMYIDFDSTCDRLPPFCSPDSFWRNIQGLEACLAFQSADGSVQASAIFENDTMRVRPNAVLRDRWEANHPDGTYAKVVFDDATSLRDYLFATLRAPQEADVLNWLLENQVETEGNLNLLYRFSYMATELLTQLKVV